jgi:predicted PurR-regulated permease PerM
MFKSVLSNPWLRASAVLAGMGALVFLAYLLSPVLVPLLFAFIVAYVLDPVIDAFERKGVSRGAAIAVVAVLIIVIMIILPLFLMQDLFSGAQKLAQGGAEGIRGGALQSYLAPILEKMRPTIAQLLVYAGWIKPGDEGVDISALVSHRLGALVQENAANFVRSYASEFAGAGQWAGKTATQILAAAGRSALNVLESLANIAIFTVVAVYLLKDFDRIVAAAKDLLPPSNRERVSGVVAKIDEQIHGFLRGQVVVCACLGFLYASGLFISGVPFAIPIGLIGGTASFVPYLGFALTSIPSIVLVLLQHGLDWHVLGVFATFAIVQTLEGAFLTPKIVGDKVGLGPVWVILAIMVFSSLLGFLGLLLAVPLAAALKVLVAEGLACYKSSSFFVSEASVELSGSAACVGDDAASGIENPPTAGAARRPRKRAMKSSTTPNNT